MRRPDRAALDGAARGGARLGLAAAIVLSPFRASLDLLARPGPPVYGAFTDLLLFWSDLAILAILGLWAVSLAVRPRRVTFGPRFVAWPAAGLLAMAWLGVPFSIDVPLAAWTAIRSTVLAALALYVLNELGGLRGLHDLRWPVAAMVGLQAIVGLGQVARQASLGLAALGEHSLDPRFPVSVITTADGTRILRAYGLTDHPNILGGVLAVGLLLLAGLIAHSGAPGARRVMAGTLALAAAFAVGAAALLVTFSRGAWIGLAAGAVVGTLMLGRLGGRRPALARQMAGLGLAGALAVAPLTLVFLPVLGARTGVAGPIATETRSISERGALAEVVSEVAAAHPVLGVGIGTLPLAVHAAEPAFAFDAQPASIVALDVTAELGLAGGLLYVALAVGPWVALLRRRAAWTLELAAASAALAAVSVLGFFDYYTWSYQAGRIWAWLVLGLWIVAWRASTGGDRAAIALGGHADAA